MSSKTLHFGRYSVEVDNLDKIVFPEAGISKGEVIDYYDGIGERMVPYLRDRALTVHRFPDGIEEDGFYQQRAADHFPDWFDTVTLPKQDGDGEVRHMLCNQRTALVYLANLACLSLHSWLSRCDRPRCPDRLVFDLDPPDNAFDLVRAAARALHELLDELNLPNYLLATGGRGLHVVVPLNRTEDFDSSRGFAKDLVLLLAQRDSERFTTATRKDQREGRLFLDYLRNAYGQTSITPYSLRGRAGAPVAVPLAWDELDDKSLSGNRWSLKTVRARLAQLDVDPWANWRRHARGLGVARRRLQRMQARRL